MLAERWEADAGESEVLDGGSAAWERLYERIAHRFGRVEVRARLKRYLAGLLSQIDRKNGWQLAEAIGEDGPQGVQRLLNAAMWDAIERIVLAFPGFGYRRVAKALAREGWMVNHKRVLRMMRQEALLWQLEKHFVVTTDSRHAHATYPNLLAEVTPTAPPILASSTTPTAVFSTPAPTTSTV